VAVCRQVKYVCLVNGYPGQLCLPLIWGSTGTTRLTGIKAGCVHFILVGGM